MDNHKRAADLYRKGNSLRDTSEAIGVSPETVRHWLIADGIEMRERGHGRESAKELSAVARNVKRLRERAGLTQGELAAQIDLSPSTIRYVEQATGDNFTAGILRALADHFGVTVDKLLEE